MSQLIEKLASEFPQLEPSLVSDVWHASFGNISHVRDQLRILAKGFCEDESSTFGDSEPKVLNVTNPAAQQHDGTANHTVDSDPRESEVELISGTKDSTEALDVASERLKSSYKGCECSSTEDLDKKSRTVQLLQLIESFGELGSDIVSSVFDSCQNDIEKAVTKLSEMTESMGIERYAILKPGDDGCEQIAVAMTAVVITSGSLESLIDSCAHITDFGGRANEVVASPIIINSYPCVAEDLCCPFGELAYLKIIGWGRTNGSLCAIIQCDVLKFEENPARIKLSLPSECVVQYGPVEVSEADEFFEETKAFWITGRISAQLSNGLICDEWPPKGYVDPFFLDQDADDQPISETCSFSSDASPLSVHTLSTVGFGVNVDLDSVDEHTSVLEYAKADGSCSRKECVAHMDGAETGNVAAEVSKSHSDSPEQERELSRFFDCDVSRGGPKSLKENGVDFTRTEEQWQGAALAPESRDLAVESHLALSLAVTANQSEGTAIQISSSGDDASCESSSAHAEIAVAPVATGSSSVISVAEVASDRACEREYSSTNGSGPFDHDCEPCSLPSEQVLACDRTCISETESVQNPENVENVADFGCSSSGGSGEVEYLPPWLRDQDGGSQSDPADKVAAAGLDAFHQQLHGPSEALSPSNGFSSCCVPWLKEEWNLQTTDASVLLSRADSNIPHIHSSQCDEPKSNRLASDSLPDPESSSEVVSQKSPACAPVSALVWAEAIAYLNENKPPEVNDAAPGLRKRASLTSYKNIGEPDSPVCVPVSALVWGEALALSRVSAGSDKDDTATQHPSLSSDQCTVASRSISFEAGTLTRGCDLHALVSACHEEDALPTVRRGQSRLRSDSVPEVESVCCEMLSDGNARLVCGLYEYIGEVRDNKPHGWGLQKFKGLDGELSGLTYRGNFVDGLPHCSRGVAVWSSGLEFCGEFNDGCPSSGSITEPDGTAHCAIFPQTGSGLKLLLSEISELHILEAISRGKSEASMLEEFQESWGEQAHSVRQDQVACNPKVKDVHSQSEECKPEYEQQFGFLRNLFPGCEEPVITGILEDCGGDVGKAIEFLLPAEDVRPPQEKKRRGRKLQPILMPKGGNPDQTGSRKPLPSSGWAAHGDLARRLNMTTSQEQLTREFPGLSVGDIEEALKICEGDVDETRQQLLILEMSRKDPSSIEAESFGAAAKSSLWAVNRLSHRQLDVHAPVGQPKLRKAAEIPLKDRCGASITMVGKEAQQPASGETSSSAAADAEAWRVSTSKRTREARPNASARARFPAEQYEGMGGDELRRLGFQHAKMNADLSRMAVAAFQAGDRIEAARLSEKALRHQEQFQVLNELARARIIETFNPDMDGRLCVDLHQLFVAEALELLEAKLRQWAAGAGGRRLLVDVVTGAGNHSREGRAVLRPRVKAWLEERGMRYYPINDGMLKVDVSTFPRG